MEAKLTDMLLMIKEYLYPRSIESLEYWEQMLKNNFGISSLIIGALFIAALAVASGWDFESKWIRFVVKMLAAIVLINVSDVIFIALLNFIGEYLLQSGLSVAEQQIVGAFNPVSILLLCIVLKELYGNYYGKQFGETWRACFFSICALGISAFMSNGVRAFDISDFINIYFIIRVVLAGLLCVIAAKVKYGFMSYIILSIYFIVTEAIKMVILLNGSNIENAKALFFDFIKQLAKYKSVYLVIGILTGIWVIFDILVMEYEKSLEWYKKAADRGDKEAQYRLGLSYENEEIKNYPEAVKWYQKSADQGYPDAQYRLGGLYSFGNGVKENHQKAAEWCQMAAEQGHLDAQIQIGGMYDRGQGVNQDYSKALYWYRKAAVQGSAIALSMLGNMYEEGKGVEKNIKKAIKWYKKATKKGLNKKDKIKELNGCL